VPTRSPTTPRHELTQHGIAVRVEHRNALESYAKRVRASWRWHRQLGLGVASAAAHAGLPFDDLAPLCALVGLSQEGVEILGSGEDVPLPADALVSIVPPTELGDMLSATDAIAAATRPIAAALEEAASDAIATVHVSGRHCPPSSCGDRSHLPPPQSPLTVNNSITGSAGSAGPTAVRGTAPTTPVTSGRAVGS